MCLGTNEGLTPTELADERKRLRDLRKGGEKRSPIQTTEAASPNAAKND